MPDAGGYGYDREKELRRNAWERHYVAKGCSKWKARELAYKKAQRKATWPPTGKGA